MGVEVLSPSIYFSSAAASDNERVVQAPKTKAVAENGEDGGVGVKDRVDGE